MQFGEPQALLKEPGKHGMQSASFSARANGHRVPGGQSKPSELASGQYRPGPANLRFRYHHDPNEQGCGPLLSGENIRNPLAGDFHDATDINVIGPVLLRIAREFAEYEKSGSTYEPD